MEESLEERQRMILGIVANRSISTPGRRCQRVAIYALKPAFRRSLAPVMRVMGRFHPNTVSGFAVVSAAIAGALLYAAPRIDWFYLVVPLFLFLRIAFNALDGMVAEARDLRSATGEAVNEFSDRVNDTLIFAGLALSGATSAAWVWGALAAVLLVSYLGILPRAAGAARRFDGPLGKADRMALLSLAVIVAFATPRLGGSLRLGGLDTAGSVLLVAMWLFVLLAAVTATARWLRAWRELEAVG